MSEYQFYEFKSVDKALTPKQKEVVSSWSSRTVATNTGAVFTYSYSDFPKDERKVVEKYFDAMFYVSNWGSQRLIFKIPNEFVDKKKIKQYCTEGLEVYEYDNFVLIDIWSEDEDGRDGWVEGEGMLTSLISLREDIIAGDYRSLYLVWLKDSVDDVIYEYGNVDEESKEADVPAGLNELNASLKEFIDVFQIDQDIISAASTVSAPLKSSTNIDYSNMVEKLTEKEKNEWLIRLITNEPLLSEKFKRHFAKSNLNNDNKRIPRRTISEIVERILSIREERKAKEKRIKEEKKLAKLKNIESNEHRLWDDIDNFIKQKKPKSYDEAVKNLKLLKELAIHKYKYDEFEKKVELLKQQYSRLRSLHERIYNAKL
ncbi:MULTISPECIES: hypothetical protein [unclassified Saccharicrinis]|uniref:hypothetical protein n=1 Tax=unclassified Saccharicrinis TaxID=2646859 RepID=UPI003D33A6E8